MNDIILKIRYSQEKSYKKGNILIKKKSTNYVNNQDLFKAMVEFRKSYEIAKERGERPKISEYIGYCILTISQRLANKPCFNGYSFKEDMIADGYENCVMYMHNFDPKKYNNPFAYFTQIIIHAFVRRIQKEKKQQCVKIKNIQDHFTFDEIFSEQNDRFDRQLYENNQEYLKNYEDSLTKKKKSAKKVGLEKLV